jgi:hypothetical protein
MSAVLTIIPMLTEEKGTVISQAYHRPDFQDAGAAGEGRVQGDVAAGGRATDRGGSGGEITRPQKQGRTKYTTAICRSPKRHSGPRFRQDMASLRRGLATLGCSPMPSGFGFELRCRQFPGHGTIDAVGRCPTLFRAAWRSADHDGSGNDKRRVVTVIVDDWDGRSLVIHSGHGNTSDVRAETADYREPGASEVKIAFTQ